MSFVKSLDEIMKMRIETVDFYDAEMMTVYWETKPEIIKRVLPRPLKPTENPIVTAFIAKYPRTNFGVSYLESALAVMCQFKGDVGSYILSMPVDNDIAMAGGREFYGYPKKIGQLQFNRSGDKFEGWTERRGTRFLEIKAKLKNTIKEEEARVILDRIGFKENVLVTYNFKHFPAPDDTLFDYNPRLIRQEIEFRPDSIEIAEDDFEIKLKSSTYDPWGEIEVIKKLGAFYTIGNNSMRKGSVVAEAKPTTFAPYAFLKWDMY